MAQTLKIPNYNSQNLIERGKLAANVEAGSTSLPVENSQGFGTGTAIILDQPGAEICEIVKANAPDDNTSIPLQTSVRFNHLAGAPINGVFGSRIRIYRAPNTTGLTPAADSFDLLATIDIDSDQATTLYTDPSGSSQYWYTYTYYDPTSATETELVATSAARSATAYCALDGIRQAAGFENAPFITDPMIEPHRLAAQSYIDSAMSGRYVVPFTDPINPQINLIAKTLAAGYLLKEQFPGQPERGEAKVSWAETEIGKYQSGTMDLLNAIGVDQSVEDSILGEHWPNEQTPDTPRDEGGSERYFRMDDVRNDYERRY